MKEVAFPKIFLQLRICGFLPHEHVEGEAAKESVHWVEHEQEANGESAHQQQILQNNVNNRQLTS